jgi:hypothetical protein
MTNIEACSDLLNERDVNWDILGQPRHAAVILETLKTERINTTKDVGTKSNPVLQTPEKIWCRNLRALPNS